MQRQLTIDIDVASEIGTDKPNPVEAGDGAHRVPVRQADAETWRVPPKRRTIIALEILSPRDRQSFISLAASIRQPLRLLAQEFGRKLEHGLEASHMLSTPRTRVPQGVHQKCAGKVPGKPTSRHR
ncbi:MAG: hypothetical protein ACREE5_13495 [Acetobacteraceae bacterium]